MYNILMNDLPTTSSGNNPTNNPPDDTYQSGSIAKEIEGGIGMAPAEISPVTEVGKDIDLPKEVQNAGVSIHPTVVQIPQPLSQAGVQPAGGNVPVGSGKTVVLPLSDDQIAQGLHQGIDSSWRWLAEFCIRRLKQMHILLKTIGGRTVEVRTK